MEIFIVGTIQIQVRDTLNDKSERRIFTLKALGPFVIKPFKKFNDTFCF